MANDRSDRPNGRYIIVLAAIVLSWLLALPTAFDKVGLLSFFTGGAAAAVTAFGLHTTRSPIVLFGGVGAFGTLLLLTGDISVSLLGVIFIPAGIILSFAVRRGLSRSDTVVALSCVMVVLILVYVAVSVAVTVGLSYDNLMLSLEGVFAPVRGVLENSSLYNEEGEIIYLYTEEEVDAVVKYLMTMMPAVLICTVNVFAYYITAVYYFIVRRLNALTLMAENGKNGWKLNLSAVSAIVFIAAYLLTVILSDSLSPVEVVAFNLVVILIPGFALIGMRSLLTGVRKKGEGRISPFTVTAAVILMCINVSICLVILAFAGVLKTLFSSMSVRSGD